MFDVRSGLRSVGYASLMILVVGTIQIILAQAKQAPVPKFEEYPIREDFNQKPHPPTLATPRQRLFRTRIREGVEKGWGVWVNGEWSKEQNRPGPNFAGHYIVIVWGCGSECIEMAMCDAETGTVYDPPISIQGFTLPMLVLPNSAGRAADLQYRIDSRLMIIRATPQADRRDGIAYDFYFLWEGTHWRLLKRMSIVK